MEGNQRKRGSNMFDFNHGAEALFLYGAFQHLEKEGEELDEFETDNEPRNMHSSTSFNDDLKGSGDFDTDDFYDEYDDEFDDEYSDEDDDFDFDDDFNDEYDEYDDYDEDDYEDDDFDDDDEIVDEF